MSTSLRTCLTAFLLLAACDQLGPRTSDDRIDGGGGPVDPPDAVPGAPIYVLPAGSTVPSAADDPELANQIRIFDGLNDGDLEENGGVLVRAIGNAEGEAVRYWSFGAAAMEGNFAIKTPVYLLVGEDGVTPIAEHPPLLDSLPGDSRYSAVRQIFLVPVTAAYAGQLLPSVEAIAEALALGLIEEPLPSGTWRNMPVVATGTRLEVGGDLEPLAASEAYARGVRVEFFPLGIEQPLRNNQIPVGHSSRLLSGVATGDPPSLPTSPDPQPVFQYGVPEAPPTDTFNYTPVVIELSVRLATGVEPADIDDDGDLFNRSGTGSISGYHVDTVASFTVTTTVLNQQVQFAEGSP